MFVVVFVCLVFCRRLSLKLSLRQVILKMSMALVYLRLTLSLLQIQRNNISIAIQRQFAIFDVERQKKDSKVDGMFFCCLILPYLAIYFSLNLKI